MSATNIVPMPKAQPPAQNTAPSQQAAPSQQWWGGYYPSQPIYPGNPPPGCAPACAPSSLMQCYCDIQNSMQFISAIMIDLINNNPAVAEAMIAAIEKSGSALPLIGVTNGSNAQPGQVGEYAWFQQAVTLPTGPLATQNVSMGVLQPGDWDVWAYCFLTNVIQQVYFYLNPEPPGFSTGMGASAAVPSGASEGVSLIGQPARALISVPTLMAFTIQSQLPSGAASAVTMNMVVSARRAR